MNLATILTERLAILGGTGSGKSYAARGLAELNLALGHRLGVIDPTGVWWGLRMDRNGRGAGHPVVLFGGDHADLPLSESAGRLIAQAVASSGQSWIVDTSALRSKAAERRFMLDFLDGLYEHNRAKITLIVDEADRFSPQRMSPEMARLHERMEEIVRRGRVRGFTPWLITQRPASLNKDVLSQATAYICMQMTGSHDRSAIADVIEGQADKQTAKAIVDAMPRHKVGSGMVWAPKQGILLPTHFPRITTFDSMRPEAALERADKPLPAIDLGALKEKLATVEEETRANDPAKLKAEVARLQVELRKAAARELPAVRDEKALAAEYERGCAYGFAEALGTISGRMKDAGHRLTHFAGELGALKEALAIPIAPPKKFQRVDIPHPQRAASPPPAAPRQASPAPSPQRRGNGHANEEVGRSGLRRMLTALAQRPEGLTNRQIGVRAALSSKTGTFRTYLSKARASGWITDHGDRRVITSEGLVALGAYEPLPIGRELLDHWLRELGDSGAARILGVVAEVYPDALGNAEVGERANLSPTTGTFRTYVSKLRALELITGRSELKASEELFQ